jgi:hypothetical protein
MNETHSEEAVAFKRRFRLVIIILAVVEFIVTAFVVSCVART